jgi:hypothetical protein
MEQQTRTKKEVKGMLLPLLKENWSRLRENFLGIAAHVLLESNMSFKNKSF